MAEVKIVPKSGAPIENKDSVVYHSNAPTLRPWEMPGYVPPLPGGTAKGPHEQPPGQSEILARRISSDRHFCSWIISMM